jgi:hypothetical protein
LKAKEWLLPRKEQPQPRALVRHQNDHFPKPARRLRIPDIQAQFTNQGCISFSSFHSSFPVFTVPDMSLAHSNPPGGIISATLAKYTALTDRDLDNDPLAAKIKSCYALGSDTIYPVLQQHAHAFHDPSKLTIRLKSIVDNLQGLSTTPALSEAASPQLEAACRLKYIFYITTLKCFVL